jgi:small subunit ribosomal protein S8
MTDPIADMLTRIRNATAVKKPEVVLPFSKLKFSVAQLLEQEKYVDKVDKIKQGNFDAISIALKYNNEVAAIRHIKRISSPGQRIYVSSDEMPQILNGYGTAIISTSKGIMTSQEARRQNIGGELMCEIW